MVEGVVVPNRSGRVIVGVKDAVGIMAVATGACVVAATVGRITTEWLIVLSS